MSFEWTEEYYSEIGKDRMQSDWFLEKLKIYACWKNEIFKNTPMYELLECRTMLAKLILKNWLTIDSKEAILNYNKSIKQYLSI